MRTASGRSSTHGWLGARTGTPWAWAAGFPGCAERSALERINARLDDGFRIERYAVRGKDRMTVKVGLSLAVMMALALGSMKANAHERMRSLIRPPPAQAA